jgi:hypothetical protein
MLRVGDTPRRPRFGVDIDQLFPAVLRDLPVAQVNLARSKMFKVMVLVGVRTNRHQADTALTAGAVIDRITVEGGARWCRGERCPALTRLNRLYLGAIALTTREVLRELLGVHAHEADRTLRALVCGTRCGCLRRLFLRLHAIPHVETHVQGRFWITTWVAAPIVAVGTSGTNPRGGHCTIALGIWKAGLVCALD